MLKASDSLGLKMAALTSQAGLAWPGGGSAALPATCHAGHVCAPSSTIDMSAADGRSIPIEQRSGEEVTEMWYTRRMAPEKVKVYNPAFDVTDHSMITGIITERGLCRAPFDKAFKDLGF